MSKPRDPRQFTKKETIRRLQAAKSYLGNKERIAYMRPNVVYTPPGYDPESDESYYAAPRLQALDIKLMSEDTLSFVGYDWLDDTRFKRAHATQFVDWCYGKGAIIGETVSLIFYSWKKPDCSVIAKPKATKFATLWLGTWHHAPIVAWSDGSNVKVNFLPEYIDLVH